MSGQSDILVTHEALGLDWVAAQETAKLLAQFANVPLDYAIVDALGKNAINSVENLLLRKASALIPNEMLENLTFSARQRDGVPIHFNIPTVEENFQPFVAGSVRLIAR